MASIIPYDEHGYLVRDKVVAFHIEKNNPKRLTIRLEGNFCIYNDYESPEACRKEFEALTI